MPLLLTGVFPLLLGCRNGMLLVRCKRKNWGGWDLLNG